MEIEPTITKSRRVGGRIVITAQDYLNGEIVSDKVAAGDYVVGVIEIDYDDDRFLVVIDGNHSFEAAISTGNDPVFEVVDYAQDEADGHGAEWALREHSDNEYRDAFSRQFIW